MTMEFRSLLFTILILSASLANAVDLGGWMNTLDSRNDSTKQNIEVNDKISLVFVYSSSCPYCRKFAPTLKEFALETGLNVESVTADGGKLVGFEDAIYSPELISSLGVQAYPTLFAIDNSNSQLTLLGQGNLSKDELYQNFVYLKQHLSNGGVK